MKNLVFIFCLVSVICLAGCRGSHASGRVTRDTLLVSDTIQYHTVRINKDRRIDSSVVFG